MMSHSGGTNVHILLHLMRQDLVICALASMILFMVSAPYAAAQAADRFVLGVETENADGETTFYVGTPAGESAILIIAPNGETMLTDADNSIRLHGIGSPIDGVTIKETFSSTISAAGARAQLILLDVTMPGGTTLDQSRQADEVLADDSDVTAFSMRRKDESWGRTTARQRLVDTGVNGFTLAGPTASALTARLPLGGFVFDVCGNLTAIASRTDSDAAPVLLPVDAVSNILRSNEAATDFPAADACQASEGASKKEQRAQAAIDAAEQRARENEEEVARLERETQAQEAELRTMRENNARASNIAEANERLEALRAAQDTALQEQDSIAAQIEESRALLNEATEEARQLADDAVTRAADAEGKVQIGAYILAGVGALALLALGFLIWFFTRSRRLSSDLAAVKDEKRDIEEAKAAAEASWHDCVLENEQGLTVKLPGRKLLKANGGVTVGRSREDADVVVDRDDVSRRHARFDADSDTVELTDLGSTNKTRVNGGVLDHGVPRKLYDGDRITFGTNEFVFRIVR